MKPYSLLGFALMGIMCIVSNGGASGNSTGPLRGEVLFDYGIIGKIGENADTLIQVRDNDIMNSGDLIRIMFNRALDSFFYVILKMSNDDYSLFYSAKPASGSSTATMTLESLEWLQLDEEPGTETVFLVSSKDQLVDLENSFSTYEASRGEDRRDQENRIRSLLTTYTERGTDSKITETALLATVDKRTNIGRIYRGPYDEQNQRQYLFSRCTGPSVIGDMIRIIHR